MNLLDLIRQRSQPGRIKTADAYLEHADAALRFFGVASKDLSGDRLVYDDPEMKVLGEITREKAKQDGIDLPPDTQFAFRHIITAETKDRDGDILRSTGAQLDPAAPLLWQHLHPMPIGKMVSEITPRQAGKVVAVSAIVAGQRSTPLNDLAHDAILLLKNGVLRFSHGFRALEFEELKESEGQTTGGMGFDVKRFEIMEVSLVSVPSNTAAALVEMEREFESEYLKSIAATLKEKRPAMFLGTAVGEPKIAELRIQIPGTLVAGFGGGNEPFKDPKEPPANPKEDKPKDKPKEKGALSDERPQYKSYTGRRPVESKHFDVDKEELIASKLEYEWCSRFLSVPVKQLMVTRIEVASIRMGSFLEGLKEATKDWDLHDTRNITYDGQEVPPQHETIQLSSRLSSTYLTDGLQFWKCKGYHLVTKLERTWRGILLTTYAAKHEGVELIDKAWDWASENNFLKGEAFSLTGDFLQRKGGDFSEVFLEKKNIDPVKRATALLNSRGKQMPNRGMIFLGPPGTGKTLSGRIMMNQAKATFIWLSARDFWKTGSIGGLCAAFDLARELAPSIVFVEDVDNWLDSRTVDVIKTEMDGVQQNSGVLTILTTNFPERLPEALIDRPGRFHDVLRFDLPSASVRQQMLKRWLPDTSEKHVMEAVKKTEGYSGAHIYELANFAKTIQQEEQLDSGKALDKALQKIDEQRELITESQLSDSRYRPRSTEMSVAKAAGQHWEKANERTLAMLKAAVPFESTPGSTAAWDGEKALDRVRKWAGVEASTEPGAGAWAKYKRAFARMTGEGDKLGDFSFLHHDIEGGKLVVNRKALGIGIGILNQSARNADGLWECSFEGQKLELSSSERKAIGSHLQKHFAAFDEEPIDVASAEDVEEKAGRAVSKRNVQILEDVKGDLEEMAKMDIPRGCKAMCERCVTKLAGVISSAGGSSEDDEDEEEGGSGDQKHGKGDAKSAAALLLASDNEELLRRTAEGIALILGGFDQDRKAEEYRAFRQKLDGRASAGNVAVR